MAEAAGSGGCEQQKAAGGQGALASGAATAPLQPRRKFSLPWFRQSSVGISTASKRLPKQHTIGGVGGLTGPNDSLGNLEVRSLCVVLFYKAVINEFGSFSPQLMLGILIPQGLNPRNKIPGNKIPGYKSPRNQYPRIKCPSSSPSEQWEDRLKS